jgi:hypothetical protein
MLVRAGILALSIAATGSSEGAQDPRGVALTVRLPELTTVEVALDEIELQWRDERGARLEETRAATGTWRADVRRVAAGQTVFAIRAVAALPELSAIAKELEDLNPGSAAHLVLYERGRARSEASRMLLGREVALLLDELTSSSVVLDALRAFRVQAVPSVSRAYVVEAADPLGALALADRLRATPGVETAYPLVQRRQFSR